MLQRGQLLAIATRAAHRGPMTQVASAAITRHGGVAGDLRGKPGRRQVTVLACRAWQDACAELGADLPWTTRRANLLVDGIELRGKVGYDLHIGGVVLTICGETTPCARMDEARPGLRAALTPAWRGGVICTVVRAGTVAVGDEVVLSRLPARQLALAAHARARALARRSRQLAARAKALIRELVRA